MTLFEERGSFEKLASFWILHADTNYTELGKVGTAPCRIHSIEILTRAITVLDDREELDKIKAKIKESEAKKVNWANQRHWLDMKHHKVGIRWNRGLFVSRIDEVYPNGLNGSEEFSIEELRAMKYRTQANVLEPELTTRDVSEPMSIESLPEIDEDTIPIIENQPKMEQYTTPLTGPIFGQNDVSGPNQELTGFTLQMPTGPILDEPGPSAFSGKKLDILRDESQKLTAALPPMEELSIDENKENEISKTFFKRDSSILTPRCDRSKKIAKTTETEFVPTPTYVVNNANQMIDNFFNETNVFHKKSAAETLRLDTPTLGYRGKNMTARLFADQSAEMITPQQQRQKLNIFHESILGSNASSVCTTPSQTLGNSFCFDESVFDGSTPGESTRAVPGKIELPDISKVVDNDDSEDLGYDPWSDMFVKMQMGQMMIKDDPVNQPFSERKHIFNIKGVNYSKDQLLGEGAFAKVYLCCAFGDSTKVAIKVQKKGNSWEPWILQETSKRLAGSIASSAISDYHGSCLFSSGEGVLITSYYSYGTLLDMCAFCRPKLAKKSMEMRPAILFFSAQIISLMLELHTVDILHADFKPDNIMLTGIETFDTVLDSSGKIQGIKLIDFGRAINNRAVSHTVPFTGKCYTSNFSCPQMRTKSKWRYQVDLYALGMSLHVIMFGDYYEFDKKLIRKGKVPTPRGFPRHFNKSEWGQIFEDLLNHDGLGDGLQKLQHAKDYCIKEYESLDEKEKASFGIQFSSYLAQK